MCYSDARNYGCNFLEKQRINLQPTDFLWIRLAQPLHPEMNLILKNKDTIIFQRGSCSYESSPIFSNLIHSLNEVAKKYFNSKLVSFEIGSNFVDYYRSESGVVVIWCGSSEQRLDMNTVYRNYANAVLYGDMKLFTDKYGSV